MVGIRRIITTERPQEWEDVLGHDLEHLFGFEVLEPSPAEVFVESFSWVFAFRKRSPLHRLFSAVGFVFLQRWRKRNED